MTTPNTLQITLSKAEFFDLLSLVKHVENSEDDMPETFRAGELYKTLELQRYTNQNKRNLSIKNNL